MEERKDKISGNKNKMSGQIDNIKLTYVSFKYIFRKHAFLTGMLTATSFINQGSTSYLLNCAKNNLFQEQISKYTFEIAQVII